MTPRTLILAAGSALVLVVNGIVLGGVAHNRAGAPESRIDLSQRELSSPWNGLGRKENSGLSLTLHWRVSEPENEAGYGYYGQHGGAPAWLDEKRMAELGFDVERARGNDGKQGKNIDNSEREVLVVLELAGAAWQQSLAKARQRLAHQEDLLRASPTAKELIQAEKRARELLAREENENTRLFAIDVGTDLAALRAKYPDHSRYPILRGKLRLRQTFDRNQPVLSGYLGQLDVQQINVPHALRGVFESLPAARNDRANSPPAFVATVAVGKRLEPWIEAVARP